MGKRSWGKIAAASLCGIVVAAGAGLWGLVRLADRQQAEDTARVGKGMEHLAQVPVKLMDVGPACVAIHGEENCAKAHAAARRNAGMAKFFNGAYYLADHQGDMSAAFGACSRRHGWSSCRMDAYGDTYVISPAKIAVPADERNMAAAQFVWMLPGHETTPAIAADGKKYYLTLQ